MCGPDTEAKELLPDGVATNNRKLRHRALACIMESAVNVIDKVTICGLIACQETEIKIEKIGAYLTRNI
jgi:hypothetical protein